MRKTRTGSSLLFTTVLLGAVAVLSGCASQPLPSGQDDPAFLSGLLHGLTALFALIASPFFHFRIYAFPNAGLWYDLGFCLGFSITVTALLLAVIPFLGGFVTRRN